MNNFELEPGLEIKESYTDENGIKVVTQIKLNEISIINKKQE